MNQSKLFFGEWCNGNTTDFGSVIVGSNPASPTKIFLMATKRGIRKKRKVRLKINQSAQLVHKNDRTRVARKDGLMIKQAPTRVPDNAPTFKIKIRKKR